MTSVPLRLDWCSHRAAVYATKHWHYLGNMPAARTVKVGVWEYGKFIGVVVFGTGPYARMGLEFGCSPTECASLSRVALRKHNVEVTRILRIAISMLRRQCPGLRALISYADTSRGHVGRIYQAGNWTYIGESTGVSTLIIKGQAVHRRTALTRYGTTTVKWLKENVDPLAKSDGLTLKHKYALALDKTLRPKLKSMSKPYPSPSRPKHSHDAPELHSGEGGVIPTRTLQAPNEAL